VRPQSPPWSLGVKLGLGLFLLMAGAMAMVYFAIVPRLESRLVNSTFDSLRRSIPIVQAAQGDPQDVVDLFDGQLNARVALIRRLSSETLTTFADSGDAAAELDEDPVVLEAAQSGEVAQGLVERDDREFVEVASAVSTANGQVIFLLSAPLAPRLTAVNVVRRDLLVFGGVALAASWLIGAAAAVRFTRRIRRLEAAADRIAGGDFALAIVDTGQDEVAELAHSFERMRQRLAQLDGARREFIANASHELRTPLFALSGFLELLADEEVDEATRRDFIETSRGQVERLTRLAADLLDLSRLDAGHLGLASEAVDLRAVAAALTSEFGALAEAGGHPLRADAPGQVIALGDEGRVMRIGRALVENALRHTPRGTSIEVSARVWVERAELAVHDDGPGVGPTDQGRVFERFYRGAESAAEGSGIGLAIAQELAHHMGGNIELRSEPGSTTFALVLKRSTPARPFPRENALV
jgi:signal transduction histidine kinase